MRILVSGAGGFIAGHLVEKLLADGHFVCGVDIKPFPEWWQWHVGAENLCLDLRDSSGAYQAFHRLGMRFDRVYHLAARMGGIFEIENFNAPIIRDNTLININMIEAARVAKAARFLFSSSACVYPVEKQRMGLVYSSGGTIWKMEEKGFGGLEKLLAPDPLKESDVYPASSQHSYGWEKLHAEHLCKYYQEAGWLETRVARFHNCYGPEGSWNDGREKAPAALCRKVAEAKKLCSYGFPSRPDLNVGAEIEIWGDGTAVRSFMHVDDCVEGLIRLMESDHHEPLNIGRDRAVSISELADIIIDIAGMTGKIQKKYVDGPVGVQWRNSDNSLCREILRWEPGIPIEKGLLDTYIWIEEMVKGRGCEGNCNCFPLEREK